MCPGEHGSGLTLPAHGGVRSREFSIPFFQTMAQPLRFIWRPAPMRSLNLSEQLIKVFWWAGLGAWAFPVREFADGGQAGAQLFPSAPWLCAEALWLSNGHPCDRMNNSGQWRFTPCWATFLRPGGHFSPTCLFLTSKMNVLI